jgi:hypothetical protein
LGEAPADAPAHLDASCARHVGTVLRRPADGCNLHVAEAGDEHGAYSDTLNREVIYADVSPEDWERELRKHGLPEHLILHLVTMGELHRAGRYDRLADGVERVTGRPAMSVREFVSLHADQFGGRQP